MKNLQQQADRVRYTALHAKRIYFLSSSQCSRLRLSESTDGATMFIPAEAIFAEVHANYPEVIAMSQRLKVWLVSPSTLMAVLTNPAVTPTITNKTLVLTVEIGSLVGLRKPSKVRDINY